MNHPDVWRSGEHYEQYVGRWSREVAPVFLDWLKVPVEQRWLDIGCGTGALSSTILRESRPASVIGIDSSDGFLAVAQSRITDARARFLQSDAALIPLADGEVDVAVSGLMLNFLPEPLLALTEWQRAATAGATIAAYVWDYGDGMELMRAFWSAAVAIDPDAARFDEGRRFQSLCTPVGLADLWQQANFRDIDTRPIDIPTVFADFEDYWTPFLGGQGVAPAYVATLSSDHVDTLRERLRASLPTDRDGSIHLIARAWAVRGSR